MKLSVHIITYNHRDFIKDCLEGVLKQKTSFDYEIIIGDDCSSDGTVDILMEYRARFPEKIKLVLFEKRNEGIPGKVNFMTVFNNCIGEYMALCDGDDYWCDENKLQKQVDFLEANSDFVIAAGKARICRNQTLTNECMPLINEDTVYDLADFLQSNRSVTATVVFRNILTSLPRWFKNAFPGDYPLWLLLLSKGGRVICFNDVLAVYRMHENGVWSLQSSQANIQKMSVTMLRCAQQVKIEDYTFLKKHLVNLEKSIVKNGYTDISRFSYIKLVLQVMMKLNFGFKKTFHFLTPLTRRYIRKGLFTLGVHYDQ